MGYCLSAKKIHKRVPILIIICIDHLNGKELDAKFKTSEAFPFMRETLCDLWARKCLLLSSDTISDYATQPLLQPMVALGIFFTQQNQSPLGLRQRGDRIIRLLYHIANEKVDNECFQENQARTVLLEVRNQMEFQLEKITKVAEDPSSGSREKLVLYARDGIDYLETCKRKYSRISSSSDIVVAPMASPKDLNISEVDNKIMDAYEDQLPGAAFHSTDDFEFIKSYREGLKGRMNWTDCHAEGCKKGFFVEYKSAVSVKEMYYRKKRKT